MSRTNERKGEVELFQHSFRLRLNSLLATYSSPSAEVKPKQNENERRSIFSQPQPPPSYPRLRERAERERPRSIRLKPQEYFLVIVAVFAISALIFYNLFMFYYDEYSSKSISFSS